MTFFLSGLLALLIMLPAIVLLGWLEHVCDDDAIDVTPRRNTWQRDDIQA